MDVSARLTFDRVRFDEDTKAHLVLTLKAPAIDWQEKRARICVVPVIDVSGSMSGQKLDYAKRSVLKLIDHLKDDDYAGVVVFDDQARVAGPPGLLTPERRNALRRAVTDLRVGGSTNFADGMLTALRIVNQMDLAESVVHRIIMFTDGQANRGPATRIEDMVKLLDANKGIVTASAFGYGADASQDFLADFSRHGKGNYAYVKDPDAALTAFGKELGALVSTYGTDLVIEVEPQAGNSIASVLSDVEAEEDAAGHYTIRFPEILAEEARHIVLDVKLAKQKSAGPRSVNGFNVRAHYDLIDKDHHKIRSTVEAKGKVQFVKDGEQQTAPDKELDAIVALCQVVRAQAEAEVNAKKGNYVEARNIMLAAAASTSMRGHAGSSQLASNISARVQNHASYSTSGGYLRGVSAGATRGYGVSSYDESALQDLQIANVVTSNSAQDSVSTSFSGGGAAVVMPDLAGVVAGAQPVPAVLIPPPAPEAYPDLSAMLAGHVDPGQLSIASGPPPVKGPPPTPQDAEEPDAVQAGEAEVLVM